jgi:hypothetical protein
MILRNPSRGDECALAFAVERRIGDILKETTPTTSRAKTKWTGVSSVRAGRRTCPGLGQKLVDLGPERPARFPLIVWKGFDGRLVADTDQVSVGLPVLEFLPHQGLGLGLAGFCLPGPERQVGPQPVESLLPPAGFFRLLQRSFSSAELAAASAAAQAASYRWPALRSSASLGSVRNNSAYSRAEGPNRLIV